MYEAIDSKAIEVAQFLSNLFQKYTGQTNFLIAKALAALGTVGPAVVMALVNVYRERPTKIENPLEPTYMLIIMIILSVMNFVIYTGRVILFDHDKVIRAAEQMLANPERTDPQAVRKRSGVLFLIFLFVVMGVLLTVNDDNPTFIFLPIAYLVIWLSYIFLACTPLPPVTRTKVQAVEAM